MMKTNHTRLCASAAIAAALALSSTPLLAQVAETPATVAPEPVLTIPETWTPPPPEAAVVLPTELPETTTVVTPEPTTSRTTTTTTTTRTVRAAAPLPARATVVVPSDAEPVAVEEVRVPVATDVIAETVTPVVTSEPAFAEEPAANDNAFLFGIGVLAAIAALVLAIWGFFAIGRRKPVERKAAAIIERPVVTPPAPMPIIAEPAIIAAPVSPTPITAIAPAPSLAHSGAAVPLPRTIPPTFAERDALLKRMIAAKPDRANPFVTKKARLKRARLIIQSLGYDFADRKPWIDLSQYPGNWPEQSRSNYAAA